MKELTLVSRASMQAVIAERDRFKAANQELVEALEVAKDAADKAYRIMGGNIKTGARTYGYGLIYYTADTALARAKQEQ